jgi:hypothetical protein
MRGPGHGEDGATLPAPGAGQDHVGQAVLFDKLRTLTMRFDELKADLQAACSRCRACSTSVCICLINASFPAYFTCPRSLA